MCYEIRQKRLNGLKTSPYASWSEERFVVSTLYTRRYFDNKYWGHMYMYIITLLILLIWKLKVCRRIYIYIIFEPLLNGKKKLFQTRKNNNKSTKFNACVLPYISFTYFLCMWCKDGKLWKRKQNNLQIFQVWMEKPVHM